MKIVGIVDLHGNASHAPALAAEVPDADLLLIGGDLTNFGRGDDAAAITVATAPCAPKQLAVLGNCDYPEIRDRLIAQSLNLDRTGVMVDGVRIIGVGGSTPCPGKTPNEYPDEELGTFLSGALGEVEGDGPMVMVSHQPPADTVVDRVPNGSHVGSPAVRAFIEEHQPLVCLSGHIHEGDGLDRIGNTQLVNPGPFMLGHYVVIEVAEGRAEVSIHSVTE